MAPINRAVDDKAAKTLLGETFKRQLKMDGGFSTVTFICSKTDDISVMEAMDSLGLEDEFERYEDQLRAVDSELQTLTREVNNLKEKKQKIADELNEALEKVEVFENLKDELEEHQALSSPAVTVSKRKSSGGDSSHKAKRRRFAEDGPEEQIHNDGDRLRSDDSDSNDNVAQKSLSLEEVNVEISRLRITRRESRDKKIQISEEISSREKRIAELEEQIEFVDTEKRSICIAGRNKYSEQAIKSDYASGIRELDDEIAEEGDAANFNPEEERRDYDEVARNLPVFCVSSRAYHKLQGRFRQEADVPGFMNVKDTQIPQLQQHCRELTIKSRTNACNLFLSSLSQMLNSLSLWAVNDSPRPNISTESRSREEHRFEHTFERLKSVSRRMHVSAKHANTVQDFDKKVSTTRENLQTEITSHVYDKFDRAIQAVCIVDLDTVRYDRANQRYVGPRSGSPDCRKVGGACQSPGSRRWRYTSQHFCSHLSAQWSLHQSSRYLQLERGAYCASHQIYSSWMGAFLRTTCTWRNERFRKSRFESHSRFPRQCLITSTDD